MSELGTPYQPPTYQSQSASTDPLAVTSLVLEIIGLRLGMCCGVFSLPFSLGAIVLGILSIVRCNGEQPEYGGKGLAIGGLACGIISLLLCLILLVVALTVNPEEMLRNLEQVLQSMQ